jgi:hypothetical protein
MTVDTTDTPDTPDFGPDASRADHVAASKIRALVYVDRGDLVSAFMSMTSDLSKHPETRTHPALKTGIELLMTGQLQTPEAMRTYIQGVR